MSSKFEKNTTLIAGIFRTLVVLITTFIIRLTLKLTKAVTADRYRFL